MFVGCFCARSPVVWAEGEKNEFTGMICGPKAVEAAKVGRRKGNHRVPLRRMN